MAQELIISISGMRGIIGENLFATTAADYGCAFGTFLKQQGKTGPVVIGRDSRPSGPMLTAALSAGITSVGLDVIDLGIVTTPTVGIMVRHLGGAGGVVVTASHNPIPYNGIKLILDNGIAPPKLLATQIRQMYLDRQSSPVASVDCGTIGGCDDPDKVHLERVLAVVDQKKIAAQGFHIVLDSVNGAGGRASVRLLKALGCDVIEMNTEPTGLFDHTPEPIAENLGDLWAKVKSSGAGMGFAQDPDADRLAIVDENGVFIGEEFTLALCAKLLYGQKTGTAAANLSTSRMIDDIAESAGCKVLRTPVGEANVAQAMQKNSCIIGGEGNGGVIDLRIGPVRDSLVSMALVLQLLADTGNTISQLAAEVGGYEMVKTKFAATADQAQMIIDKAREQFTDARVDTSDGCRFDMPDGWVHLRTSNTEPVMRAILETKDPEIAKQYLKIIDQIRSEIL